MELTLTPEAKLKLEEMQNSGRYYALQVARDECCSFYLAFEDASPKDTDITCRADGIDIHISAKVAGRFTRLKIDYSNSAGTFQITAG